MNIALMKKESELLKVTAAKIDLQIRLDELNKEVERMRSNIDIQQNKEDELRDEIQKLKE